MKKLLCLLFALLTCPNFSQADVTYNLVESGGNILISGSGSIDLRSTVGFVSLLNNGDYQFNARNASGTFVGVFPRLSDFYLLSGNVTPTGDWVPQAFRDGLGGDDSQGAFVNSLGDGRLFLPVGYQSNAQLDFDATIFNTTFAELGFAIGDSGTVSWSNNNVTERIIMNWNAIPEPSSATLLGVIMIGGLMRRRR